MRNFTLSLVVICIPMLQANAERLRGGGGFRVHQVALGSVDRGFQRFSVNPFEDGFQRLALKSGFAGKGKDGDLAKKLSKDWAKTLQETQQDMLVLLDYHAPSDTLDFELISAAETESGEVEVQGQRYQLHGDEFTEDEQTVLDALYDLSDIWI